MRERISKLILPVSQDADLARQEFVLNVALLGLTGLGLLFTVIATVLWLMGKIPATGTIVGLGVLPFYLGAYWFNRRGWTHLAAFFPVIALLLGMAGATIQVGIGHSTLIGFAMATSLASLLLGLRRALYFALLGSMAYVTIGLLQASGQLSWAIPPEASVAADGAAIVTGLATLIVFNWLGDRQLRQALLKERVLTAELQTQQAQLEQRVAERTSDLARRSAQLNAAIQVARETVALQDMPQLLDKTVQLISDHFGFYHSGIFLLDPSGKWAVLQAASSEGGQRMLARGHRLSVGREGIVGHVTGRGEPRIALDVGDDAVFFDNPDLPYTCSELALPLKVRGEIIGALDVQSIERAGFSDEDVAVLQILADQVAMAISNARLFRQAQERLEAERRAYGQASREAWTEILHVRPSIGYRYDIEGVTPLPAQPHARSRAASVVEDRGEDESKLAKLTLPIRVRGQIIGRINAHKPDEAGEWTPDEIALMEALTEQLNIALESARLHQHTQRRAIRERLTSEVTGRMRQTMDVETVLKTAVDEIYQALDLSELVIRMKTEEPEDVLSQ
jgi:GAF domain-containing protein